VLLYQHHGDRQNGDNLYEAAKGFFWEELYDVYADFFTICIVYWNNFVNL